MRTSKKGIELIKSFEGLKLTAYKCPADVWTIGYGTTRGVFDGQRITEKTAVEFLQDDLVKFERAVNRLISVPLNQNQFDALVSFTYNLGAGALQNSSLRKLLNQGNYAAVPEQMKRWNKAGGKILRGLVRRREAEAQLFQEV